MSATKHTLESATAALDTSPWVVCLSDIDRLAYKEMVDVELEFVIALLRQGCQHITPQSNADKLTRRTLIVVHPGVVIPSGNDLRNAVMHWHKIIRKVARDQGKSATTGSRGATLPMWIGTDGIDRPFHKPAPAYLAQKISSHTQLAYRGAAISPEVALELMELKTERAKNALEYSQKRSKKDRLKDQEERFYALSNGVAQLRKLVGKGVAASVRLHSGTAWRVAIRTTDKQSFATTIATVGLVPGTVDTVIKPSKHRVKNNSDDTETMLLPGGIELKIKIIK